MGRRGYAERHRGLYPPPAQKNRTQRSQDRYRAWTGLLPGTRRSQRIGGSLTRPVHMLIDPRILEETADQAAGKVRWFSKQRRRKHNGALLNKIIIWMFGPLFLLWTIGLVITYFIAQNIADAPYDRALSDHLRMLRHEVEQQSILSGLQLSASAITIMQGDQT